MGHNFPELSVFKTNKKKYDENYKRIFGGKNVKRRDNEEDSGTDEGSGRTEKEATRRGASKSPDSDVEHTGNEEG